MRSLLANHDLKSLACHAGAAAAAGLLLGAAMQPNLRADERPEGPQIMAGVSGVRGQYAYDYAASFTAYGEQVPDHVIGTDWLSPPRYEDSLEDHAWFDAPPEEETIAFAEPKAEPIEVVSAWEPPPREPPRYPSTEGGVAYGADLPEPPAPPIESAAGSALAVIGG